MIMTEYEKMLHNLPYDYTDKEVQANILRAYYAMRDLNQCGAWDMDELHRCIKALIPDAHPSVIICPPFHCDHGNRISIGEGSFINFNGVFLDGGGITIGSHTLIGPNCQLLTPDHPHDYMERRQTIETGLPIHIGDDCWLGGGVIVCPGVTIGNRVIVGAGSVVTHDIPDDVVVAGNPAKIIKKIE
jgi:maltose O-acetyltransferase